MQVFIRPAFFCAPQWLERKTTPHNHTETRERSVVQLWTISPHKKGNLKRSHVKIADTNYIFTNRKVRRSSDENVWTEKKLAQMKTALLNLTQTCCSVVPFEFWVTLSCSFSDVFSKKSFIQKGEFVTSDQNVQNNEFSMLFRWTSTSVCYRAGLILAVWRRPRRWSNSRAALIAPSVWAGLWQLIRPAHQQQPGVHPSPARLKLIQDGENSWTVGEKSTVSEQWNVEMQKWLVSFGGDVHFTYVCGDSLTRENNSSADGFCL